jgi:3-oxoacid CoA-transferase subunit A
MYVMERALKADFAFVKAWKGDKWGNLVYRKTSRNFNPVMATAGRITIAEVEQLSRSGNWNPTAFTRPLYMCSGFSKASITRSASKSALCERGEHR